MSIISGPNLIDTAFAFAKQAHDSISQKRKYTGKPYWTHVEEVGRLVENTLLENLGKMTLGAVTETRETVVAAFLHDVIEDVYPVNPQYNYALIQLLFGKNVTDLVRYLTDVYTSEYYPHLNRAQRKELERQRLAAVSPAAKTIKLADLLSNTKDIVKHDKKFAKIYLEEKRLLLPYLAGGNEKLFKQAQQQVFDAIDEITKD